MGLDTSHDCWHGPYSQFMRWRLFIAKQIGVPLMMMEGFNQKYVVKEEVDALQKHLGMQAWEEPYHSCMEVLRAMEGVSSIPWSIMGDDPIVILLSHSDCDGRINWEDCYRLAKRLKEILLLIEKDAPPEGAPGHNSQRGVYDGMYNATVRFIGGLLRAYNAREDVEFH